jgi:hypothetical protein
LPKAGVLVPLTSFDRGKLKIAAHVREELDRAGIKAQSIQCISGGIHMPPDTARLIVTVGGAPSQLDLEAHEVEDCEDIVAGEVWRKIAGLLARLKGG